MTKKARKITKHAKSEVNEINTRPLVKSAYQIFSCLISQPKHMLWILKRTVSVRKKETPKQVLGKQ